MLVTGKDLNGKNVTILKGPSKENLTPLDNHFHDYWVVKTSKCSYDRADKKTEGKKSK